MKIGDGLDSYIFIGEHKDGKPNGICRVINKQGNIYEGVFKNSKKGNGFGRFIYRSSHAFTGWFLNDRIHGNGQLIQHDGGVFDQGWYINGVKMGSFNMEIKEYTNKFERYCV